MKRQTKAARIFWRQQTKNGPQRAYGDFRDFSDVGGAQEALIAAGTNRATSDRSIAEALVARRLAALQEARRNRAILGIRREAKLAEFIEYHLAEKLRAGRVTERWVSESRIRLHFALEYFGDVQLSAIQVSDVGAWLHWLSEKRIARSGNARLAGGTLRHYLNTLSNLYRRAAGEGIVASGFNPVSSLLEKPSPNRLEAKWFDVERAGAILAASKNLKATHHASVPYMYPLIGTFLLTGGRESEVLGLTWSDISFERETVTIRPNEWRRLKTRTSLRVIPLWPQLRDILIDHKKTAAGESALVFPSPSASDVQPLTDFRKSLDQVAIVAGLQKGEVRTKAFRHTYCAARLQTVDRGSPVSIWTVAKELGHGGTALVERVYGHLGTVRYRDEVVWFPLLNTVPSSEV